MSKPNKRITKPSTLSEKVFAYFLPLPRTYLHETKNKEFLLFTPGKVKADSLIIPERHLILTHRNIANRKKTLLAASWTSFITPITKTPTNGTGTYTGSTLTSTKPTATMTGSTG
ncbi:MAG: hypothetical protein GY757_34100, partial [bacterium]|nr:hypothetical protein [bacterium]